MREDKTYIYYEHNDYLEDIEKFKKYLAIHSGDKNIHLIAPMFGALPLATKLKNELKCKVSIVKMSRYGDNDKKASWIYLDDVRENDILYIVDDLYDQGVTIKQVKDLVQKSFPNNDINAIAIFGRKSSPDYVKYFREHPGKWIKFEDWE